MQHVMTRKPSALRLVARYSLPEDVTIMTAVETNESAREGWERADTG
jgi:hypothetical protein